MKSETIYKPISIVVTLTLKEATALFNELRGFDKPIVRLLSDKLLEEL